MEALNTLAQGWLPLFSQHMFVSSVFTLLIIIADRLLTLNSAQRYALYLIGLAKWFLPPLFTIVLPAAVPAQLQGLVAPLLPEVVANSDPAQTGLSAAGLLFLLWVLLGLAVLAAILYKNFQLNRKLREAHELPIETILPDRSRLPKRLRLYSCPRISTPVVKGFRKPKLYLPESHRHLPMQQRHSILTHELAHLNSYDIPVLYLQAVALALFAINPLIWLLNRRLVYLRELRCDEIAISETGISPVEYSKILYGFLQKQSDARFSLPAGMPFAENNRSVFHRFEHILNSDFSLRNVSACSRLLLLFFGLLVLPFSLQYEGFSLNAEQSVAQSNMPEKQETSLFVAYDVAPKPIGGIAAIQQNIVYPEQALRDGVTGKAIVNVLIDENGQAVDGKILKSSGHAELDRVAIEALKAAAWEPALYRGKPVKVWIGFPVVFRIQTKR